MPEGTYTMIKPTKGTPTWEGYTPGEGAYYYAYAGSGAVTTYKKASAIIILPTDMKLKETGGGRNAYISFGVDGGSAGAVDIGNRNRGIDGGGDAGLGWEAFCGEVSPSNIQSFDKKGLPLAQKGLRLKSHLASPTKKYHIICSVARWK